MKKFLFKIALLLSVYSNAQVYVSASYSDITEAKDKPYKGVEIIEYQAKDGSIYKLGDKITIGFPSTNKSFAFITRGDGLITDIYRVDAEASGQKTEIIKFGISGTRRSGFSIWLKTKSPSGIWNYNIDLENAISKGEIKSYGLTSNEALEELKRAKDKLDLNLITKEEYELKKSELSKLIK